MGDPYIWETPIYGRPLYMGDPYIWETLYMGDPYIWETPIYGRPLYMGDPCKGVRSLPRRQKILGTGSYKFAKIHLPSSLHMTLTMKASRKHF